ncbi:MAG: TPR end-of-group domain-containing protein [Candidatus Dormibacteria bacterium]
MTYVVALRASVVGLLRLAALVEEQLLLLHADGEGSATCWAAPPTIEHNSRFKLEQVARLRAINEGREAPATVEVDHRSPETYRELASMPPGDVDVEQRGATDELVDSLAGVADADLLDPSRHPWLRGRHLWLQVVVRGFWHPLGHVGGFFVEHGRPDQAVALHTQVVAAAEYLDAPTPALGMARYSLACAQAQARLNSAALESLRRAVTENADLMSNAGRDPDLAPLSQDPGFRELLSAPA